MNKANAQSTDNWVENAAGTYESEIWNIDSLLPGTTEFIVVDNTTVVGRYELDERGTSAFGVLLECQAVEFRTINCIWHDKYGIGNFAATFSEDFSSFDGYWSPENINERFTWDGSQKL